MLRRTLLASLAASLVLAALPPASADHFVPEPSLACTATGWEAASCSFTCEPGDLILLTVARSPSSLGATVTGSVECGAGAGGCLGVPCVGAAVSLVGGAGTCDGSAPGATVTVRCSIYRASSLASWSTVLAACTGVAEHSGVGDRVRCRILRPEVPPEECPTLRVECFLNLG